MANTSRRKAGVTFRKQAEEILRGNRTDVRDLSLPSTERLVYELEVHQLELEMQNEELRRAQQTIQASRDRYADLYDFAPVGYFTLNAEGTILEANLTAAAMLGVERSKLIKQLLTRYFVAEDQDIYYFFRKKLLETGARSDVKSG